MNQTKFEDTCSKCNQPCTRVRRESPFGKTMVYWITSCCGAKPLAVPVVKE